MTDEIEIIPKTATEYLLYKLDRTLAIAGVIGIACIALWLGKAPDSVQIATAAVGGLVGYVGGRSK
jgi:hypothetical protein